MGSLKHKRMNQTADLFEDSTPKQQEKTLRDFKDVLQNLIYLFRTAVNADTSCLYWINRSRKQFVKEAHSTSVEHARFEDRVRFEDHYFNEYKDISAPVEVTSEAEGAANTLLIPFINNGETVALTALEWSGKVPGNKKKVVESYIVTLGKLLNTYLEITILYETEQEWVGYEKQLAFLNQPGHYIALLDAMLQKLQLFLSDGSVTLIANADGGWATILNSKQSVRPLPVGLTVEKRTVAADAIENDSTEFAIHFNDSPKRVSPREELTEGATLAVPLIIDKQLAAIILIVDENPLVFNESTKHKLKNIVRLTELEMQSRLNKSGEGQFLANKYGAIIPDIWERTVDTEILRLKEKRDEYTTWAGFVTLPNLSKLRTQLRVEELRHMQKDIIRALNPGNFGVPGFVGFHTDYQYFILFQSKDSEALARWKNAINEKFRKPFVLSIGKQIESRIQTGFIQMDSTFEDSYDVVQHCKQALNREDAEKAQDT